MGKIRKLGVLSDVHNDLDGLTRALDILGDCDKVVHLGDLVEDDPVGNEIVQLLVANRVEGVVGTHDELALKVGNQFSPETRAYLAGLPTDIQRGDFWLVHDNPLSKQKGRGLVNSGGYIKDRYSATMVFEEAEFGILLVGHTHRAKQYEHDGRTVRMLDTDEVRVIPGKRYILNPGPVCAQQRGTEPSVGVFDFTGNRFSIRRLWG